MSSRRIILTVLLAALGLSAIAGILAITASSEHEMFLILWAAILTAIACGLLMPLTLLTDRPRLRVTGYLSMAVVVGSWLSALGLVFMEFAHSYELEDAVGMSFAFTMFAGIPAVGISLLQRFKWARFAVPAFLAAAGLGWLCGQLAALCNVLLPFRYVPGLPMPIRWDEGAILSGLAIYGLGFLIAELLVNVRCGDRRYFRFPGIALAVIDMAIFLFAIWLPQILHINDDDLARAAFFVLVPTAVLAHINVLLMARLRASQRWLQFLTIGLTVLGGLIICPMALTADAYSYRPLFELLARLSPAVALAVGCGSVALIVLSMLNRKPAEVLAPGALTATDVTLFCPRCQTRQTLPLGDGTCKNCELHISVKVVEPRCPACGYLLYQLTSQKCPECGAQIRESSTPPPATVSAEA